MFHTIQIFNSFNSSFSPNGFLSMYRANITVHDIHCDSKHKHNVSLNHPAASHSHTFIYTEHLPISRIGLCYHHDRLHCKFNSILVHCIFYDHMYLVHSQCIRREIYLAHHEPFIIYKIGNTSTSMLTTLNYIIRLRL